MRFLDFFRRTPDPQAEIFAEALDLYEDGLEIAVILERYSEDVQDWLKPLLSTGQIIGGTYQAEEASYYFEGSLKAKVLAAATPVIGGVPEDPLPEPSRFGQFGAAVASVGVLGVAAMLGVITFGFVTAGESVPGEWNYNFKRATEQAQVRFASGDERINVRIRLAQERIDEIQALSARGNLSEGHIDSFTAELDDIRELAEEERFDALQQAKVRSISETAEVVLADTEEELATEAEEAVAYAAEVAAAVSTDKVKPLDGANPEATATPEPGTTPTPEPTPVATEEPSASEATPTPEATISTGVAEDPEALTTPTDPDAEGTVTTGVDEDPEPLTTPEPTPEGTVTTGVDENPEPLTDPEDTPTPTPTPESGGN
ncbi:MAG: DUF5667 domain-containing protein [Chloroflexi bacterium]|nr:DUF5667 domain-containing protein [Chloroflexota bacterium]